jgi:hypothetical protein
MDQQSQPADGITQQSDNSQETIFAGLADTTGYDRNLRRARIWLYVIAGIQLVMGIYEYSEMATTQLGIIAFCIDAGIGAIFLGLSLWSRKKPVTAFLTALIFYIAVMLIMVILDPSSIIKGIIIKVLFIIALIKAYQDARDNEAIRNSLS